ncbi:MAG: ATP-binding protein [Acidimicrobiales bacterium]
MNVHSHYSAGPARPARLTRSANRVVAGVSSGIANYLGIDPVIVRVAFVVLTVTTGLGIPAYIAGWVLMPGPETAEPAKPVALTKKAGPAAPRRADRGLYQGLAVGMIVFGCLLLFRNIGLAISDHLLFPLALAGCGAAVLWARSGVEERAAFKRWASGLPGSPFRALVRAPVPLLRLAVGTVLVLSGMGAFLASAGAAGAVGTIVVAMLVTVAGLALVLGPWIWSLASDLSEERRERIRQEERADIAAHLHDSVLQTLALIQRNADNPRDVSSLARRQERELRAWLYGDPSRRQNPTTLAGAMEAMVEEVEALHGVDLELITVGEDCPLDHRLVALIKACREAAVNAAKHSGADQVTVFVETEPDRVTAFVRDRGKGFDPDGVPADRRGITESIHQRLARRGGRATIWSLVGEGTEVQLEVPRD